MTTPSITVEQAIGQLKPTEDFLRTWRKVGMIVGYRNLGRALSAIAPRKGAVKGIVEAQAAKRELTDDELDDLQTLQERIFAAEMWFDTYPAFAGKLPLRTVIRTRKRKGLLARGSWHGQVEQIAVTREMAEHVKHHYSIDVEPDKKATRARRNGKGGITAGQAESDRWWADCEDQAWGQDVFLEEWFGARAGTEGHTFDDLLPMFRKALALKAELPRLQAQMREIEVAA